MRHKKSDKQPRECFRDIKYIYFRITNTGLNLISQSDSASMSNGHHIFHANIYVTISFSFIMWNLMENFKIKLIRLNHLHDIIKNC